LQTEWAKIQFNFWHINSILVEYYDKSWVVIGQSV